MWEISDARAYRPKILSRAQCSRAQKLRRGGFEVGVWGFGGLGLRGFGVWGGGLGLAVTARGFWGFGGPGVWRLGAWGFVVSGDGVRVTKPQPLIQLLRKIGPSGARKHAPRTQGGPQFSPRNRFRKNPVFKPRKNSGSSFSGIFFLRKSAPHFIRPKIANLAYYSCQN